MNERLGNELPRRPYARVIKAAEADAWRDGYAFLEKAEVAARKLRDDSKRLYAAEYSRGYDEGLAAGHEEALRLVAETTGKVDAYLGSLQDEVVDLALDIVRRMLGDFDVSHLVAKAAAQAVSDIRRARYVRVRVHPDAADAVRTEIDAVTSGMDPAPGFDITVEADDKVAPGTCTVTTEATVIDASIAAQLSAFRAALLPEPGSGR